MSKTQIVDEIHKQARRNFIRRSVILKSIDDLWQADLIDIQNLCKYNKNFRYILVIIDCFSKFSWTVPLKSKSKSEIINAFDCLFNAGRKPKNLQTDQGTEFYNRDFKCLMLKYNINHYSTYSVKKASIVERVIRTLKNKLYKYFNIVGNYKWIGKPLDTVTDDYNNTVHSTTKFKPIKVNTLNEGHVRNNINKIQRANNSNSKKNKFHLGDFVRISKYKGTFQKGYTPNWSTEIFKIININDERQPAVYYLEDQHKQPILGAFYQEELLKTKYPDIYLIEKVLKKKGDRLFVKWLGLNKNENSWIHKSKLV